MSTLWEDMFRHSQIQDPTENENPFFIGAIVLNTTNGIPGISEIADGQQRASTLTVIASAVRDAMVATGFQEEAWEIQDKIIYDYDNGRPRLKLLDIGDPDLSNMVAVRPYQGIIAPVDSKMCLDADATEGDNTIKLPTTTVAGWTKREAKNLTVFRGDKKIADVELVNPTNFEEGHSLHRVNHDVQPLESDLQRGDEVWLSSDSVWHTSKSNQNKYADAGDDAHHFHYKDYRSIYLKVREDCEFFILDNNVKKYYARTQSNTKTLKLGPVNEHHLPHLFTEDPDKIIGSSIHLIEGAEHRDFEINWGAQPSLSNSDKIPLNHPLELKGTIRAPYDRAGTRVLNRAITSIEKPPLVTIQNHNHNPVLRVKTLRDLICDTRAVEIRFNNTVFEHMDHFIKTNDRSKLSPLLTLDLVNAFVKKLSVNQTGGADPYTNQRIEIKNSWEKIWESTYINQEKNASVSQDFFYNWLMASGRWKRDGSRWQKEETFEGLMASWEGHLYDLEGYYDATYLEGQFKEMEIFSKYYCEALKPELIITGGQFWHKHKQYLFVLKQQKSMKQWIPAYLAMRYGRDEGAIASTVLEVSNAYLKNTITLIMKHNLFPKIMEKAGNNDNVAGFSGQEYYGKITGEGKWISQIKERLKHGIISADKIALGQLPTTVPSPHSPDWDTTSANLRIVGAEADLRIFVFAFESILKGTDNPNDWEQLEVEHVLPKNPSRWPLAFYNPGTSQPTTDHKACVELLGNKCLITRQRNVHVTKSTFRGKKLPFVALTDTIPPFHRDDCDDAACNNHYASAGTQSITTTAPNFGVHQYPNWTPDVIKNRTKGVMKKIIAEFDF